MPELPDVALYVEALSARLVGHRLERVRLASPFLLRSVEPPLESVNGRGVVSVRRMGKRIVVELESRLFLVLHLMVGGRLHWKSAGAPVRGRAALAAFDFDSGTLTLTEAGSKKRASLHLVAGGGALAGLDRGGVEPLEASRSEFASALRRENHTVKRALSDPRLFSGIGNAYSDEILHRARLSPMKWTSRLTEEEAGRLHDAAREVLSEWIGRLRAEAGSGFPENVTAFRPEFAVHGRHGKPCPDCGAPVQRIVYADNECNYCAVCQTQGRLLADRALSRLLRDDWPGSLEELEERLDSGRRR